MRAAGAGFERPIEHEQGGRRRHVAVSTQHFPRMFEVLALEPEHILHGLDQLAAARVKQEAVEIRQTKAVAIEKIVQRRRQRLAHQRGQFGAEHDAKTVVLDVPTHDVLGIGPAPFADGDNAPAAPSPNSAVDTNIAGLGSLMRRHRLHRSTVRNSTCAPSVACARRVARARPATPPPQPRPKIGSRSTVGLSLRRLNSLASRLGMASPVIVLVTRMSMASSSTPADAVALSVTSVKRSSACFWNMAVRSSQECGLRYHSTGWQL